MKPAATFSQVVGQVVIHHRHARNATQSVLAAKLKISQSAFSRLERGEAAFNVPQLRKTAEALGVPISKLFAQAESGAQALARQGVTVLDEAPGDGHAKWLWVAPRVLQYAVATDGVPECVRTTVRSKAENSVPLYVRRG